MTYVSEEPRAVPFSREQSGLQSILRYRGSPLLRFDAARAELGAMTAFSLLGQTLIIVQEPRAIEAILVAQHTHFKKDLFAQHLKEIVGEGLLTSEDEHWKRQRKLIAPAFQPKDMQRYLVSICACAEEFCAGLREGETRDLHAEMMHLTLDMLGRTLFGQRITDFAQAERALDLIMQAFRPLPNMLRTHAPAWLPLPSRSQLVRGHSELQSIIERIIQSRRRAPAADDLLSRLISATDESGGMTDQNLRDEVITLFLAGHETTALTLTYALRLLAQNPTARVRLERELSSVLGGRAPEFAELPKLIFTRAVIQETLRLYPPAWTLAREAKHDTVVAGWCIPRAAQVLIPLWSVQRDARWFPDPGFFCPERFLPGGAVERGLEDKSLPRFAYVPFGAGPRVCVGQHFAMFESISALAVLAQHATFSLPRHERFALAPAVTLRPRYPVSMRITLRAPAIAH